jgi:hypothetical protein
MDFDYVVMPAILMAIAGLYRPEVVDMVLVDSASPDGWATNCRCSHHPPL